MIQRVQSIFLVLITICMVVALSNPIWEKMGAKPSEMAHLTALEYSQQQVVAAQAGLPQQVAPSTAVTPVWYLALLIAIVGLVALYTVFQYRNRLTQTALCAINAIMLTAIMGIVLYRTLYTSKSYGSPGDQGEYQLGFYALVAALIFNALANRFIRRDEKLVRGADRLR
ncbi:uncharacterized protein DUF4293 [Spirosoma oryzae]|uniref:Uncharacterized protein DUF4293 n=1 Tax=Spirosoma oryzae TaxID=1469603 RepID=A0A2T0TI51_9BACT|nr:DUF4293 domain-containing protein [Spirosoma oryzae]PRY45285.1 uncharacterized protein DUF4293 [Spirosoma oryzae]